MAAMAWVEIRAKRGAGCKGAGCRGRHCHSYVGRYRIDGRRVNTSPYESKREALTEAQERERAGRRTGRHVDLRAGKVTVADWYEQWLAGLEVSEKTASSYRDRQAAITARFGDYSLRSVDRSEFAAWMRNMTGPSGKKLSATRRSDIARQFVRQLDAAVSAGLLEANPLRDNAGKLPPMPTRQRERPHRYLTAAEVHALAEAADQMDARLGREHQSRAIVLTLAYGGLRWGELVALEVGDLTERGVRVDKAVSDVSGKLIVGDPKTPGSIRTVPLPRFVLEHIQAMLEARDDAPTDSLLFHGGRGARMRTTGWPRRVLTPALDLAGIERLTPHDLRHTAASLAIHSGANIKHVSNMLGHASSSLTLDVYGHLYDDSDVADRLDAMARQAANGQ